MFEVPAAKRVKRSEILENDFGNEKDNHANDPGLEEVTAPDYGFEYDFVESNVLPLQQEEVKEETFAFNLFRTNPRAQALSQPQKSEVEGTIKTAAEDESNSGRVLISIRSPTPELSTDRAEGGLSRLRPDAYYFTASTESTTLDRLRQGYKESAISGATITDESTRLWTGTHLSWRVVHLPAHPRQVVEDRTRNGNIDSFKRTTDSATEKHAVVHVRNAQRRPRPSKKRRDLTRKKSARRQAVIDATKTKEEHEKEKRNKKNRERKLKRRAKERKDKEEAKTTTAGTDIGD